MIFRKEESKRESILRTSEEMLKEMILDITSNVEDVFNRVEYYNRKYQKWSDMIRNVNLTVTYDTKKQKPAVFIYVEDKYYKTRVEIIFNQTGKEIIEMNTNVKQKELQKERDYVHVEVPIYMEETAGMTNVELYDIIKSTCSESINKQVAWIEEYEYPQNGFRKFKVYLDE